MGRENGDEESAPSGLLSRGNLQQLLMRMEYADRLSIEQWLNIVMLWFKEKPRRELVEDILYATEAGRISPADNFKEAKPEYKWWVPVDQSCIEPGENLTEVPGLVSFLKKEVRRQISLTQDDLRAGGKDLDVQGYLSALEDRQGISFEILAEDIFIRGMGEGQTVNVTGTPGSGKTHFALQHIAAPYLEEGGAVVSNVLVADPPEHYAYANTFTGALIKCIDFTLDDIPVILLQDEGGLSRARSRAQTNVNRSQADASMVSRKLGFCHVLIYQFENYVPREVEGMRTHLFRKPNQDMVYCETDFLNAMEISGLPSIEQLGEMGRPILQYRSKDFSPFDVDADFSTLLRTELTKDSLRKSELDPKEQLKAIRQRLVSLAEGPKYYKPLDMDQLHRMVATYHLDNCLISQGRMARLFHTDFEANGIREMKDQKEVLQSWGFKSHKDNPKDRLECKLHQLLEGKNYAWMPVPLPSRPSKGWGGDMRKDKTEKKRTPRPVKEPPPLAFPHGYPETTVEEDKSKREIDGKGDIQ